MKAYLDKQMGRRFTCCMTLVAAACCIGCSQHSDTYSQSSIAVIDPQKANAEVTGYVVLAKEYLSRKEFGKAVETLDRAVSIEGATDRLEATNLLASTLPLANRPKNVNATRYSSTMSPVEVVQAYMASKTWQERVPFVLRPIETGPLMANTYRNATFDPTSYRPATILPLEKESVPIGERMTIKVDVSESSPQEPCWPYIIENTGEGYKIDWEASQAISQANREANARRALQLDNPVLAVQVLKVEQVGSYVYCHCRVRNESNKYISNWNLSVAFEDLSGKYLSNELIFGSNLSAGQSEIDKVMPKLNLADLGIPKFSVKHVTIDLGGENRKDATRYFSVRQPQ